MYVTGRLVALLAVGAIAVIALDVAGVPAWLAFAGWLAVALVAMGIDVLTAASASGLIVTRQPDARTRLDQPVSIWTRLSNPGSRRIRGVLRDAWQPTTGATPARFEIDIPAGESRRVITEALPRRRGELRSEFVTIRTLGPLGIAGRQRTLSSRGTLRVLPAFTSSRHLASRVARLKELDGNTSLQVRGQGTEFDSLREYVRGDDVRSIDWRATARFGNTMLRTWRPERDRHVVIVIDTGRTSAARVDDGTRLDASMEAALLLSALAIRAGDHVHVVAFDRVLRARVTGIDGPSLMPTLMDALADLEPALIDTDWHDALASANVLHHRPSLLVILTAHESIDAARNLLGLLPDVPSAATTVLVASTSDGALTELTTSPEGHGIGRTDPAAAHRAAAAEASLRERRELDAAMTRAGAEVVSDTPAALPPRVADRYIHLKRTGRL